MNRPLQKLSLVVILMFITLLIATTYIQFFAAPALNADIRNVRTLYKEYGVERGPIIVGDTAIVTSTPSEGTYRFQRTYKNGELYAPVTGYFSVAHNAMTGIERYMNPVLGGSDQSLLTTRISNFFTNSEVKGGAVQLTLNAAAQEAAYRGLNGRRGAAVAIEPSTGKILALVSTPSFDPNGVANHDQATAQAAWSALNEDTNHPTRNRAIGGDLYAPGSIFKIITAAAMIERGDTPDTSVAAPTTWSPNGTSIAIGNYGGSCGDGSGHTTLRTAFRESCNTPFAIAATEMGANTLIKKAEAFGFHQKLQIPLPVTPSRFPQPSDEASLAMDAFGQRDIQVSPLQMAMVAAAIANKGTLMQPYLVERTLSPDLEPLSETKPKTLNQAVSADTASQITAMMIDVVESTGVSVAAISGVKVAGKTGTAEVAEKDPHAWFVGFDASENSRVAVAVFLENDGFGVTQAAPIARDIMKAVLGQ